MISYHEDLEIFRAAVTHTQLRTGFAARLIEKDYFCTLLLQDLALVDAQLIFKGGTCLAKVHAEFYRLSEDLDFVFAMDAEATRKMRSARAKALSVAVNALPRRLPVFSVTQPLTGANDSTQYAAVLGYTSLISGQKDVVKIEVGLREPLLTPIHAGRAKTLLLNPVSSQPMVEPISIACISVKEAFAEKFRAALSRRSPAIRDFFDLDYAVRLLGLQPNDQDLVALIRKKINVPGNEPPSVSEQRLAELRRQVEAQLRPVLRTKDFQDFDLDRAFAQFVEMAAKVVKTP
jgi:predicted nucleotidyltransferase component of viral defense system